MSKEFTHQGISRRGFLKMSAVAAGMTAAGVAVHEAPLTALAKEDDAQSAEETALPVVCRSNCFQRCMLTAHVRDGKVRYMSRGEFPEEIYSGCCLKGLSVHERTYSATRIKYPMRRVGDRGSGEWERISWDDAIDEVATNLQNIADEYGPHSVIVDTGSGNYAAVNGSSGIKSLFARAIQSTMVNVCYDQAFGYGTDRVIGGGIWQFSNEPANMLWSKHILVWGANPVSAQPQSFRVMRFAQERGAKVTCIDPIFSATAARADEYVAIKPGTDVLVALAILNEVVSKDGIDVPYVKAHTTAPFLIRKDTQMIFRQSDRDNGMASAMTANEDSGSSSGEVTITAADLRGLAQSNTSTMAEDPALVWDEAKQDFVSYLECDDPTIEGTFTYEGVELETVYSALKEHMAEYTVERAAQASGVSEEKIREIAGWYMNDGPMFVYSVYGIDHYRNGHEFSQTIAVLHALTNNISRLGSSVGGSGGVMLGSLPVDYSIWVPKSGHTAYTAIPQTEIANTIESGTFAGQPFPIKAFIFSASNGISNFANQNRWFDTILPNLDFVLTVDTEFTDTANYSDIVLPTSFWLECEEVAVSNYANPFVSWSAQAIDPLYESKPDAELFALIADKMGLGDDVPNLPSSEWCKKFLGKDALHEQGISYEILKAEGPKRGVASPDDPFRRGTSGTFPTPSGRAELFKELPQPRIDFGQDWEEQAMAERFPSFTPPTENYADNPLKKKYPLSFFSTHERWRVHSQWFAVETFKEIYQEPVAYVSPEDAQARGVADGDIIEIFNDRGSLTIKACISNGIPEGIVNVPKGWQRSQVIAGGYNTLTGDESSPLSINFAYFDTLVDFRKEEN